MANLDKARRIQATIRAYLGAPTSSLQSVAEVEDLPTNEAIRKLQLQVFELSDALAGVVKELDERRP